MSPVAEPIIVLHVDDDRAFTDLAATVLEGTDDGLEVLTASSAEAGRDRLESTAVDCVVSDYDMPGDNGIRFLETVRAEYPDLPFFLFTGKGSEEVASEAISSGVTDYLQKGQGTEQFEILANRVRNAVDRVRSQRERDRQLNAIETAREGISILDADGRFHYVNGAYADLYGYDAANLLGRHWQLLYPDDEVAHVREEILPTVDRRGSWRGRTIGKRADGSTFIEDHVLTKSDDGGLICTVKDVSDRTRREDQVKHLHDATRELLEAESDTEIATIVARASKNILAYPNTVVRLVDDAGSTLDPVAVTDQARTELGERPPYAVDEGPVGEVYRSGEPLIYADITERDDEYERGEVRSVMYLPIGEFGTVSISDTAVDVFDQADIDIAQILTTNADAALQRLDRERELRESRARLGAQNDALEQFASVVSHDLRNPLNVARGRLTLVAEDCESEHLPAVDSALGRMEALIDDVLALAREGEAVTDRTTLDLESAVEQAWRHVRTDGS
ncbi:MAG: response regulator, partial [Haloplanus sp.]